MQSDSREPGRALICALQIPTSYKCGRRYPVPDRKRRSNITRKITTDDSPADIRYVGKSERQRALARLLPQRCAGETHHHCYENRTRKVPFRESAALVARIGSNLRSQFGILANADANRRECRANWRHYNYPRNINDLLAERVGFELTVRYLSRLSPLISAIIHAMSNYLAQK